MAIRKCARGLSFVAESEVLPRDWDAKARAERRHVSPVRRINLIAGVESHQPFGRNAVHGPAVHGALPCEGLGGIAVFRPRRTIQAATAFVAYDDVKVDLATGMVPKNEIPRAGVRTRHRRVTATLEDRCGGVYMALLNDDIEVGVAPALEAKARINRPAAIEPDANTVTGHQ